MGYDFHFGPGFGQELIIFWASFSGPGFGSTGAFGDLFAGDGGQKIVDEGLLFSRRAGAGLDGGSGVAQKITGEKGDREKKGTGMNGVNLSVF